MMSYQHAPSIDEDEETAVPFVPTHTPPSLRSWRRVVTVVVAGIMLVVMAGGAVVLFETPHSGLTTTAAEGLVVKTKSKTGLCPSVDGAFSSFQGLSTTTTWGQKDPFQTCYKYGSYEKYCWTNAYNSFASNWWHYLQCVPNGDDWNEIDANLPLSLCDTPCYEQHKWECPGPLSLIC